MEGKHDIFTNETLAKIGEKYGKSNGEVILRWLLQGENYVVNNWMWNFIRVISFCNETKSKTTIAKNQSSWKIK